MIKFWLKRIGVFFLCLFFLSIIYMLTNSVIVNLIVAKFGIMPDFFIYCGFSSFTHSQFCSFNSQTNLVLKALILIISIFLAVVLVKNKKETKEDDGKSE